SESDSSTEFTESTELPAPLDFSELILSILLILSDNKKSRARKNARPSPRFLRRHYPHQVQGVVHESGPLSHPAPPHFHAKLRPQKSKSIASKSYCLFVIGYL